MDLDNNQSQLPNFNQSEFGGFNNGDENKRSGWLIGFFVVLIGVAFYGGYKLSERFVGNISREEDAVEELANISETESADIVSQEASLVSAFEAGKGEVKFMVSAENPSVLRELFVHNPFKDSWILVYDGYRELSSEPQEIIRVNLAAIQYDKIRARTLQEYFDTIEQTVDVKENSSAEVVVKL